MKVHLMHPDHDTDLDPDLLAAHEDLRRDLNLDPLLAALGGGDDYLAGIAAAALLTPLTDADTIAYRHAALTDCLTRPDPIATMYRVVVDALDQQHKNMFWLSSHASTDSILHRCLGVLALFADSLEQLHRIAEAHHRDYTSAAFTALFTTMRIELAPDYLDEVRTTLGQLRSDHGTLLSARLGRGNSGVGLVLRAANPHGLRERITHPGGGRSYSFRIPPRDIAGSEAVAALRAAATDSAATTLAASVTHISGFLRQLRAELGFYLAVANLHHTLTGRGQPTCLPTPVTAGTGFGTTGLYDPCLCLETTEPVIGNDITAPQRTLVVITGANQGGKSTFLRSVGIAQLMLQAGIFVPATEFHADLRTAVFTHFKREEDPTMTRGKFDDELHRMSQLVDTMPKGALLLCNESFAATNEQEGSAIAAEVIDTVTELGVKVFYVTHLHHLAHTWHTRGRDTDLFLRADRNSDGTRTYRLHAAPPLPTSYGEDLYRRIFATTAPTRPAAEPTAYATATTASTAPTA